MKNPKFCIAVLIFSFFILHFNCFAADQLTITTYYPSPYGVYKILRIYPSPAADCTSDAACANRGEVCYNMTIDQFLGCIGPSGSSTWTLIGGGGGPGGAGGWTDDGTVVRLTTLTDSVGIGTTAPGTNKLEIVGGRTKTTGGLVIETRDAAQGDPSGAELIIGRMWLRTDI